MFFEAEWWAQELRSEWWAPPGTAHHGFNPDYDNPDCDNQF